MEIVLVNKNFLVILCFKLFIRLEICIDFQNCIIFDTQNYKELNYHHDTNFAEKSVAQYTTSL